MSILFTDDQQMLRDTVSGFLADRYGFETRQSAVRSEVGWQPRIWTALAEELGLFGAPFAEQLGGFGGGAVENMIVMEAFGKALVIEPYLGTVVIADGFLKYGGHPDAVQLSGQIVAGRLICAFAYAEPQGRYDLANLTTSARKRDGEWTLNGRKSVVIGAPWATHLVVTARTAGSQKDLSGISVFLVEKASPGISSVDYPTIDGTRASDIVFENVRLPDGCLIAPEDEALPLIERVVDEAIAACCAEACGVMHMLYTDTIDYTRQRRQFGVPIASFQVLQHRMVDMFIHLGKSLAMTTMATRMLDAPDRERALAVSSAKVQIGQACRFVGQNAVQLHGGIGITDELRLSHAFKRATVLEHQFGSVDHHLARFEALSDQGVS